MKADKRVQYYEARDPDVNNQLGLPQSGALFSNEGSRFSRGLPVFFSSKQRQRLEQAQSSYAETSIRDVVKRAVDITVATSMLVLLAPAFTLIAGLIYLRMGRPILFAQVRVGHGGKAFNCYKFRSMANNAKEALEIHLRTNPVAAAEWAQFHKLKDDPRITPLGKLLRKSSLDEFPQLINVLKGEMSCVGPRPITFDELARYKSSKRHYLRVRPGMTGLWQISGRSKTSYTYRVALDRNYVMNWSVALDLKILVATVPAVLRFTESC